MKNSRPFCTTAMAGIRKITNIEDYFAFWPHALPFREILVCSFWKENEQKRDTVTIVLQLWRLATDGQHHVRPVSRLHPHVPWSCFCELLPGEVLSEQVQPPSNDHVKVRNSSCRSNSPVGATSIVKGQKAKGSCPLMVFSMIELTAVSLLVSNLTCERGDIFSRIQALVGLSQCCCEPASNRKQTIGIVLNSRDICIHDIIKDY